jgi:hypothetical protein
MAVPGIAATSWRQHCPPRGPGAAAQARHGANKGGAVLLRAVARPAPSRVPDARALRGVEQLSGQTAHRFHIKKLPGFLLSYDLGPHHPRACNCCTEVERLREREGGS